MDERHIWREGERERETDEGMVEGEMEKESCIVSLYRYSTVPIAYVLYGS